MPDNNYQPRLCMEYIWVYLEFLNISVIWPQGFLFSIYITHTHTNIYIDAFVYIFMYTHTHTTFTPMWAHYWGCTTIAISSCLSSWLWSEVLTSHINVPVRSPTAAGASFQQNSLHTEAFVSKCCVLSVVSAPHKYSALCTLTHMHQVNFHFVNFEERRADLC